MLHMSYSVLIFVLRPHPTGTQEKYNTGILSNWAYSMAEDDTSCIVPLVGQLLALVGKVPRQFIR